jgi:hypothetical protein
MTRFLMRTYRSNMIMLKFCLLLMLFFNCLELTEAFRLSMLAKGFGAPKSSQSGILKPTRPSEYRKVEGSFAKLLSKTSEVFEKLRGECGVSRDIYVRLENSETCWFVGKINHKSSITPEDACTYYIPLLVEYSKSLRPAELSGPKRDPKLSLQVLAAPGNTEMDVAKNSIDLELLPFPYNEEEKLTLRELSEDIGYEPEIYMNGEAGFRCKRDINGKPLKAAFNPQMVSPAEFEKMKGQ